MAHAGAGSYRTRYDGSSEGMVTKVTGNGFGFNVGGGPKFAIDENVGPAIDIRFHTAIDPTLEKTAWQGDIRAEMGSSNMRTVAGRLFAFQSLLAALR